MKPSLKLRTAGFTLVEICVTLGIMVVMCVVGVVGYTSWSYYRDQTTAEAGLNLIATAQRSYMMENPAGSYANLTTSSLAQYLPNGVMPTMPAGAAVNFTSFPPTATRGATTWTAQDY